MSLLQEIHETRKVRLRRIEAAAWKPSVKIEPVVVAPPEPPPLRPLPPAHSVPLTLLLRILSQAPPVLPVNTYPSIRKIQRIVAAYCNLLMADMLSERRHKRLVRVRQRAMYLCKQLTPLSYPEIGRKFGGRDHTTVLHGVRKITELLESDPALVAEIEELKQLIGQAHEKTPAS